MAAWYRTGTIGISGKTVTGAGTNWTDNKMGIGPGQALLVPADGDVKIYEIARVDSATKLTLVADAGSVAAGSAYAIMSFYTDSRPDFARRLSAQLGYYQSQMDGWQTIMTGTGSVTVTAPDGTPVTISSFKKLTADMAGKLDKSLVVGSVSSGAVIETGNNSNGRYIKYADGTMICYGNYTNVTATDSFGGSYYRGSKFFTFPATFSSSSSPVVVPTSTYVSGGVGWVHSLSALGVSGVSVWYMCYQQGAIGSVNYIAIGRWK